MLHLLLEPFGSDIILRALIEVVLLGLVCGPLGVWVLLLRHSYAAESLAHGMLPGLALAALGGAPLLLGAAVGIVLSAGLVVLAGRDQRLGGDLGVAVVITALTGLGALLALFPDVPTRLTDLLFGDLLAVSSADLAVSSALVAAVGAGLALAHRGLSLSAFDPGTARALGTSPRRFEVLLLALVAVALVVAVRGLGSLLAVGLLLAPAAAALRLASRLSVALGSAALAGVVSGVIGLYASHYLRSAAGASVALVAVGLFALSLVVGGTSAGRRRAGGPLEAR